MVIPPVLQREIVSVRPDEAPSSAPSGRSGCFMLEVSRRRAQTTKLFFTSEAREHPAATGREHQRRCGRAAEAAAAAAGDAAGERDAGGADRQDEYDPGLGKGRAVLAGPDRRAGGDGDLPVPAVDRGDNYPFGRGSAVDCGHAWRDGPAGVQPGQPEPDGAADLDRMRRG